MLIQVLQRNTEVGAPPLTKKPFMNSYSQLMKVSFYETLVSHHFVEMVFSALNVKRLSNMNEFRYNDDWELRNQILGLKPQDYAAFENVGLETLQRLVELKFLNPEETQNASPTAQEFMDFMSDFPQCSAHGYAISRKRPDYRVTLEGLFCKAEDVTKDLRSAFSEEFADADELDVDHDLRCWWD